MNLDKWNLILNVLQTILSTTLLMCLTWMWHKRKAFDERMYAKKVDTDVILDALAAMGAQVNSHIAHTMLEHEAISKGMNKVNSRLQFLMASKIAEELAAQKAREASADYENAENGHD